MAAPFNIVQFTLSVFEVLWDVIKILLISIFAYLETIFRFFIPPKPKSLAGEIILITGSANGIGREICTQLTGLGATLVCWDIDKRSNEALVKNLKESGVRAFAFEIDISDRNQVETIASKTRSIVGGVSIIINNAGIMPCHKFLSHNPRELERVFQVNVLSHFWILREFLPSMLEKNKGHIVTVASAAGLIGTQNLAPYCGTKHAVHGFIEGLKEELRIHPQKSNIQFTTVYPFTVQTDLVKNIKCETRYPKIFPILKPEEVAERLINGMRRNYEYVHLPPAINLVSMLLRVLPSKITRAAADMTGAYVESEDPLNHKLY